MKTIDLSVEPVLFSDKTFDLESTLEKVREFLVSYENAQSNAHEEIAINVGAYLDANPKLKSCPMDQLIMGAWAKGGADSAKLALYKEHGPTFVKANPETFKTGKGRAGVRIVDRFTDEERAAWKGED